MFKRLTVVGLLLLLFSPPASAVETTVSLGGFLPAGNGIAALRRHNDNSDHLFVIGAAGGMWHKQRASATSPWSPSQTGWNFLGTPRPGVSFLGTPAVGDIGNGFMVIVGRASDGHLYLEVFSLVSMPPTWIDLGAPFTGPVSDPTMHVAPYLPGHVGVFVRDGSGFAFDLFTDRLGSFDQFISGWSYFGGPSFTGPLAATFTNSSDGAMFGISGTSLLGRNFAGGWLPFTTITGVTPTTPITEAVQRSGGGVPHVFTRDSTGAVQHSWGSGGLYTSESVSSPGVTPPASTGTIVAARGEPTGGGNVQTDVFVRATATGRLAHAWGGTVWAGWGWESMVTTVPAGWMGTALHDNNNRSDIFWVGPGTTISHTSFP